MRDGEAAYREARALGYTSDRIILMGASLGTGVAIALAATHGAAAIVLEAPYLSALDVASAHYPVFPVKWLMLDRFRSDLAIRHVHIPVLIVHGENDDVVPISSARRLFELANEPKTFVSVPGGNHLVLDLPDVLPCVVEWIDAQTSQPPRRHNPIVSQRFTASGRGSPLSPGIRQMHSRPIPGHCQRPCSHRTEPSGPSARCLG